MLMDKTLQEKNNEISKNTASYISLKIILLDY